jgi:hypothetical protein
MKSLLYYVGVKQFGEAFEDPKEKTVDDLADVGPESSSIAAEMLERAKKNKNIPFRVVAYSDTPITESELASVANVVGSTFKVKNGPDSSPYFNISVAARLSNNYKVVLLGPKRLAQKDNNKVDCDVLIFKNIPVYTDVEADIDIGAQPDGNSRILSVVAADLAGLAKRCNAMYFVKDDTDGIQKKAVEIAITALYKISTVLKLHEASIKSGTRNPADIYKAIESDNDVNRIVSSICDLPTGGRSVFADKLQAALDGQNPEVDNAVIGYLKKSQHFIRVHVANHHNDFLANKTGFSGVTSNMSLSLIDSTISNNKQIDETIAMLSAVVPESSDKIHDMSVLSIVSDPFVNTNQQTQKLIKLKFPDADLSGPLPVFTNVIGGSVSRKPEQQGSEVSKAMADAVTKLNPAIVIVMASTDQHVNSVSSVNGYKMVDKDKLQYGSASMGALGPDITLTKMSEELKNIAEETKNEINDTDARKIGDIAGAVSKIEPYLEDIPMLLNTQSKLVGSILKYSESPKGDKASTNVLKVLEDLSSSNSSYSDAMRGLNNVVSVLNRSGFSEAASLVETKIHLADAGMVSIRNQRRDIGGTNQPDQGVHDVPMSKSTVSSSYDKTVTHTVVEMYERLSTLNDAVGIDRYSKAPEKTNAKPEDVATRSKYIHDVIIPWAESFVKVASDMQTSTANLVNQVREACLVETATNLGTDRLSALVEQYEYINDIVNAIKGYEAEAKSKTGIDTSVVRNIVSVGYGQKGVDLIKGSGVYAERFENAKNVTASLKLARTHDQTNEFTGGRATHAVVANDSNRGKKQRPSENKALALLNQLGF